jgi:spermidine/putrescine transport system ATP-binding protein
VFERPESRFAALFMGIENVFGGHVAAVEGRRAVIVTPRGSVTGSLLSDWCPARGDPAFAAIRAEHVRLMHAGTHQFDGVMPCRVLGRTYKGKYQDWTVDTQVGRVISRVWDTESVPEAPNSVGWPAEKCIIGPITAVKEKAADGGKVETY